VDPRGGSRAALTGPGAGAPAIESTLARGGARKWIYPTDALADFDAGLTLAGVPK
jgi:hypothetical protein